MSLALRKTKENNKISKLIQIRPAKKGLQSIYRINSNSFRPPLSPFSNHTKTPTIKDKTTFKLELKARIKTEAQTPSNLAIYKRTWLK